MDGIANSVIVGAGRASAGAASLVQGVYGSRGNLELVVPDAIDGIWVFWFNSDLPTDPLATPNVPQRSWSEGLHFAAGHRYRSVQILQSPLGPDHLEVLGLTTDGVLQSWFWSPGPGFTRRTADAAGEISGFIATIDDSGSILVHVDRLDGNRAAVTSQRTPYPDREWTSAEAVRTGALHDAAAVEAELGAAGVDRAAITPGTARHAHSTRGGGTAELTFRDADGALRHIGLPDNL